MRTFGTEIDDLIDVKLEYGTNDYEILWFQNGMQRDIDVSKAVIHFVGAKYPLGNVTIDYLEFDTKYLNFLEEDAIRLDIIEDGSALTVGTYYVAPGFTKNRYDASYTAYSSLVDIGLKLNTWESAPESATIGYIVHHFIDALGIAFDTEPSSTLTFNATMIDFSSITLGELLGYCACIERCNYVLRGVVLHRVTPSSGITKEYNMDDIVYSENLSQIASDAVLDYIKINYKTVSQTADEDGQITYGFNDASYICKNGTESCGFELNIGLVPTSESAIQSCFNSYFNSVKGMDCNSYNVSFLGDARVEVGDKLNFYNDGGSAVLNVAELIWEWDGGLKCTVSSGSKISNTGSGYSIQQVVSQIQAMTNAVKNVQYNAVYTNELYAKTAKLGFVSVKELSVEVAKMGYLNAASADLKYASIDLSNIAAGSIKTAMIDTGAVNTAQIADGSITNAKIVDLSANKITAGTLSVERLEIRGSNKSIVYALNNITGALQSQNVNTLNGEILTQRTITADKLVANSITANEIAANAVTANKIAANAVTAEKINVSTLSAITANLGTITAGIIKSTNYVADSAGMKLDLSTGSWDSKYTKIASNGMLTCSNIKVTGGSLDIIGESLDETRIKVSYGENKAEIGAYGLESKYYSTATGCNYLTSYGASEMDITATSLNGSFSQHRINAVADKGTCRLSMYASVTNETITLDALTGQITAKDFLINNVSLLTDVTNKFNWGSCTNYYAYRIGKVVFFQATCTVKTADTKNFASINDATLNAKHVTPLNAYMVSGNDFLKKAVCYILGNLITLNTYANYSSTAMAATYGDVRITGFWFVS